MHHDTSQLPRSLSVVDDSKIRKDLFSQSSLLLAKIRKLEKDRAEFLSWDQILYQEWYHLTFRKELQTEEQLEKRHRALSTFQVHLKHIAMTAKVPLEQAYTMLKEEEQQYQSGDDAWKFIIERLRLSRFENATKTRAEPSCANSISETQACDPKINFSDIFCDSESPISGLKRQARSVYHYLNTIDDGKMARHLSVPTAGYQLFKESFQIAMTCGDWKLLGRVWRMAVPPYQQKFLRNMPAHIKDFLQQVISENVEEEALETEHHETELQLRSIYRRLARLLHPDTLSDGTAVTHEQWASLKWERAQEAYRTRNRPDLERIELLCRLELGHLNDLTTDEILHSSQVLDEEFENLKNSLRAFRKHPAWRFSSRRQYESLTSKLRQEFAHRAIPLESEIKAMESLVLQISK